MTETSISLLSILIGIIASNLTAYFSKTKTLSFTANTIIGVFGSILLIKSFGRLGFAPNYIVEDNHLNIILFCINMIVSSLGGILGFIVALKVKENFLPLQKTKKMKQLILSLTLFLSLLTFAQTDISGIISTDTTWSLDNSPYNMTGSVLILNGATLTIEPGVEVNFTNNYKILIKGNLISSGTSSSLITFNGYNSSETYSNTADNVMILFESTNLSNSIINYNKFIGSQNAIQLADESEHNQDDIKNSGILTVTYSDFDNANVYTDGYAYSFEGPVTYAELKFENSTFNNLTIKGYYPRSEPITFTNCTLNNTEINSDSYNYGIKFYSSLITSSYFKIGCCGANFIIENSTVYNSPFSDYNDSHSTTINKSLIINSIINLSSGDFNLTNSIIAFSKNYVVPDNFFSEYSNNNDAISSNKSEISNSAIYGYQFGAGLNIRSYSSYDNISTITKSTFANNNINIKIDGTSGDFIFEENNFLDVNESHSIYNSSDEDITAINNYWGTSNESEIQNSIYDLYDDFDKGIVNYVPYASSYYLLAPISPPSNVTKTISGTDVLFNWNANSESDTAGYKLHYGNPTGYSYDTTIDLGNVTTFTLSNGDINTEYAITTYDVNTDGTDDMVDGNESWYTVSIQTDVSPTLSSNEPVTFKQVSIYPNPARNYLNIKLSSDITFLKGEIYNSLGQKIMETKNSSFSIKNLSPTNYLIRIITSEGTITKRFIKK